MAALPVRYGNVKDPAAGSTTATAQGCPNFARFAAIRGVGPYKRPLYGMGNTPRQKLTFRASYKDWIGSLRQLLLEPLLEPTAARQPLDYQQKGG